MRRRERPLQAAALRWFARTLSKVLFEWGRLAFHRQRRLRLARVFRRRCLPRRRRATLLQASKPGGAGIVAGAVGCAIASMFAPRENAELCWRERWDEGACG